MRLLYFALAAAFVALHLAAVPVTAKQRVLLYSRTAGFRHASIPNAIKAFKKLGEQHGFSTHHSEDEDTFENATHLYKYDALVFVSVSGQALSKKGEGNMRRYIENGGGFMGIHEACDAMYHTPWYGRLLGAYFDYHPYLQRFTLNIETKDHPSTSFLSGNTWRVRDEVYTFNSDPRDVGKTVVLTADSSSYKDPTGPSVSHLRHTEGRHPIAWYEESDLLTAPSKHLGSGMDDKKSTKKSHRGTGGGGRAFYSGLGHTKKSWKDDDMLAHMYGGLRWVLDSPTIRSNNASLSDDLPGSDFEEEDSTSRQQASASASSSIAAAASPTSTPSSSSDGRNGTVFGVTSGAGPQQSAPFLCGTVAALIAAIALAALA